jgi:hypothetical protein
MNVNKEAHKFAATAALTPYATRLIVAQDKAKEIMVSVGVSEEEASEIVAESLQYIAEVCKEAKEGRI